MNSLFFQDFRLEVKGTMQIINIRFNSMFLKPSIKPTEILRFFGMQKARPQTTLSINNFQVLLILSVTYY